MSRQAEKDRFINHYHCPDCDVSWEDESPSTNDDECPKCGKPYTPETSEDIKDETEEPS